MPNPIDYTWGKASLMEIGHRPAQDQFHRVDDSWPDLAGSVIGKEIIRSVWQNRFLKATVAKRFSS